MILKVTEKHTTHIYPLNTRLETDILEWVIDRLLRAFSDEAIVEFLTDDEYEQSRG